MYAIIRVRGNISVSPDTKKTFELLNLNSVNHCSIWQEENAKLRMIKKVENYATFGTINEADLKELIEKRGKAIEGKLDVEATVKGLMEGKKAKEVNLKNCFRLNPPKQGYERKGIKKPYSTGGVLGNRKEKIDDLIEKML